MSELIIREAVINDLPSIIKLQIDDSLGKQRDVFTEPLLPCYIDAFQKISEDGNNALLVACDNEKVIGCLQITFTQYLSYHGSLRATIESVRVAKDSRNLGIGSQLMRYAINLVEEKNCAIVQLTSNKTRKDAHRFYERLGFHATHEGMKLILR